MPNVLIRDVPVGDLEQLRSAASSRGRSLQHYLLDVVRAQAVYLRRQEALAAVDRRLRGEPAVPADARQAALEAVDVAHDERAAQLSRDHRDH